MSAWRWSGWFWRSKDMAEKRVIDWESIEREYRAGIRSLKDIGAEVGVSDAGIIKRAKKEEWARDLTDRIRARAEAKVSAATVSEEVSAQTKATEREIVEAVASFQATAQLMQRKDVSRSRGIVQKLFAELEGQIDGLEDFAKLAELMAEPDDNGSDKLNELYKKVISFPSRVDSAKKLSDSLRVLVELERKVLRIKDEPEASSTVIVKADTSLAPADAYLRMLGK